MNGTSTKTRSVEILSRLRRETEQKILQWSIGEHQYFSATKILRCNVHGERFYNACTEPFRNSEKAKILSQIIMRTMRHYRQSGGSSSGQELEKQCRLKFNDAVFILSHVFASCTGRHRSETDQAALYGLRQTVLQTRLVQYASDTPEAIWESLPQEDMEWEVVAACLRNIAWSEWPNIPRVATGIKKRVDRLKGLGNAIVPQVAYQILKMIRDLECA